MAAYDMQKPDIAKRLARIEGQVRGIARMVEEDRYCIDVLDQISAITKALSRCPLAYCTIISSTVSSMPSTRDVRKPWRSSTRPQPRSRAWCAADSQATIRRTSGSTGAGLTLRRVPTSPRRARAIPRSAGWQCLVLVLWH